MNKLYRTCRIHFSLYACLKLEFMINTCLHQVGVIKRDSLNGSKKLERRGKISAWVSTLAYMIITLSVISNVVKLDFLYLGNIFEMWIYASVSLSGPQSLLKFIIEKTSGKRYLFVSILVNLIPFPVNCKTDFLKGKSLRPSVHVVQGSVMTKVQISHRNDFRDRYMT